MKIFKFERIFPFTDKPREVLEKQWEITPSYLP